MKKFLGYCESYIRSLSIWEFGLLKVCVAAAGFLLALFVPKKSRGVALALSMILFVVTLAPLLVAGAAVWGGYKRSAMEEIPLDEFSF